MPTSEFFTLFKDRWKIAVEAEKDQRQRELDDLRFESGEHWDAAVKQEREKQGKPCLVIDLLSGPIKQVTNQQRTARPGIQISAVGNGGDPKKAKRWQGIVRRVERLSGRMPYTWAGQYQVKMGRGAWLLRNIEVGEDGEQDIRIKTIENQHTVYVDPNTKELDGSDKRWAILFEDLTHEEYKARFGESKLAGALGDGLFKGGIGDSPPEWITTTHARIAEYYYLEEDKRTRLVLSNGDRVWEDELPSERTREKGKFASAPVLPKGVTIRRRVNAGRKRVHWCLLNGAGEKLDSTIIPGEYIPVVTVWGERRNIDGKRDYRGLVRMAKSPSYMADWAESSLMEAISEAKTAPWMAEFDQLGEFKATWERPAGVKVLVYKRVSAENGTLVPPPQRVSATVDVSALTLAAQRNENHVRKTTGIPDTFADESAGDQAKLSGRAILARRAQQEMGTSDYLENLGDGIVLTAKIIMSMARDGVYDTPRLMRIWGEDEKEHQIVTYAGAHQQELALQLMTKEVEEAFDLSVGEYDIAISVGRSFQTARQETVELLSDLIPQLPPEIQVKALPILFKNMDGAGAMELAAALDPEQGPDPAMMRMQLQKADQLLQMAQARIQELEHDQAAGVTKGQMDIAREELRGMIQLELQKIKGAQAMQQQNDQQAHETGLSAAEAAHTEEMAERQAQQAARMAEQGDTRKEMSADLQHRRAIQQGDRTHRQALEQGEQGHRHAVQQIRAKPQPKGNGKAR